MYYTPDTHDTSADPGLRDYLGNSRTVPSHYELRGWKPSEELAKLGLNPVVYAFAEAIRIRTAAHKQPVEVDGEALAKLTVEDERGETQPAAVVAALRAEEFVDPSGRRFFFERAVRIKAGAQERLLEVRLALSHGHPVVVGYYEIAQTHADAPTYLSPKVGVLVAYDQHGGFGLYEPDTGKLTRMPGEMLMSAGDLYVVQGSVVEKK